MHQHAAKCSGMQKAPKEHSNLWTWSGFNLTPHQSSTELIRVLTGWGPIRSVIQLSAIINYLVAFASKEGTRTWLWLQERILFTRESYLLSSLFSSLFEILRSGHRNLTAGCLPRHQRRGYWRVDFNFEGQWLRWWPPIWWAPSWWFRYGSDVALMWCTLWYGSDTVLKLACVVFQTASWTWDTLER